MSCGAGWGLQGAGRRPTVDECSPLQQVSAVSRQGIRRRRSARKEAAEDGALHGTSRESSPRRNAATRASDSWFARTPDGSGNSIARSGVCCVRWSGVLRSLRLCPIFRRSVLSSAASFSVAAHFSLPFGSLQTLATRGLHSSTVGLLAAPCNPQHEPGSHRIPPRSRLEAPVKGHRYPHAPQPVTIHVLRRRCA